MTFPFVLVVIVTLKEKTDSDTFLLNGQENHIAPYLIMYAVPCV